MAGEYVPLVLVPRFTSYLGRMSFTTVALDVSAYGRVVVTAWRGPLVGDPAQGASCVMEFQCSDDAQTWKQLPGTSPLLDSGHDTVSASLRHRYLRVKVTLDKTPDPEVAITCWVVGHLELREE